jgi:hypothetical protein
LSYFKDSFSLKADGLTVSPEITSSGENKDIWWYEFKFQQKGAIRIVEVENRLLFELYPDQKHFLKITFFPSAVKRSLYFVKGATRYLVGPTDS